ncbi:putative membrane protein [Streptomyces nojiriensis]|nr:putative membrane protein [Streptomyces nojiriensis]
MNGGVSLAVWMGGVTHEIDLLRRASDPAVPLATVRGSDQPVFDRWRGACDGSSGGPRRRVIVDVVAGTSAGGLNGTLLATAIARGTALDPAPGLEGEDTVLPKLKKIWREDAALAFDKLLPQPGETPRPSILDGAFFAEAVDGVLESIEQVPAEGDSLPITLFVTATSLGSAAQNYQDAFGNLMACPDHRRVYRFEKQTSQCTYQADLLGEEPLENVFARDFRNDFNPATGYPNVLASAARSSASYPLAFAPVSESQIPVSLWVRGVGEPSWVMDGGVLDNAPFGPVLDAIASRELSGPVRRLLAYVVPSPGVLGPSSEGDGAPPLWTRVLGSAIGLPPEADLRTDVETIQSLLSQADGLGSDSTAFFASLLGNPVLEEETQARAEQAQATAELLLPTYRGARIIGAIFEARRLVATASLAPTPTAETVEDLGDIVPLWVPEAGVNGLAEEVWHWGVTGAERTVRLFVRDLRRRLDMAPVETNPAAGLSALTNLWLPRIEAVKRAFTEGLQTELQGAGDAPAEDIAASINSVIEELQVREALALLVGGATAAYRGAVTSGLSQDELLQSALNVEVISRAFQARSPSRAVAPFEFLRLGPDVKTPVLGEPLSGQIMSQPERKLYGTQMAHFAAFGHPSWRDWDWLVGRLDAVAHLGNALGRDEAWVWETQVAVLESESVSLESLSTGMESMLDMSLPQLINKLRDLPDNYGPNLVRNLVASAADGLAHLENPPALRVPARILARARRPLRWWLRRKGF